MTRLARALNSDDLKHHERDCDVDVLQATGSTAIQKALGVLILEAKEGAAGEGSHAVARIKDLEIGLQGRVKRIAQRWQLKVDVERVASKIARELILDRCGVCHGRGVIPMKYDGQRMVAVLGEDEGAKDVECTVCLGSGAARRDYQARAKAAGIQRIKTGKETAFEEYTKRLGEWWDAVLQSCCDAELDARHAVWRRLRPDHYI